MPGCAAIGCNNRSEKGYSMKCFPRDPRMRQEWKERVGRANWEPSKNSFLCHDHFEHDQWAETESGKIRLKRDAIPSIFRETSTRKSPRKRRIENTNSIISNTDICDMVQVTTVRVIDNKSEDDNYTLEYLDDCEYKIAFASTGSTLSYNKSLDRLTNINTTRTGQNSVSRLEQNCELAYHIVSEEAIKGLEKENVIIVSDENNREIGKLVHNNESIIIVADENNKEIGQIVMENDHLDPLSLSTESKKQTSYDEIEEKLKQICNGEDITISVSSPKDKDSSAVNKELIMRKTVQTMKDDISTSSVWTADSKLDKEIPENLKLIFGDESELENRNTSNNNSPQTSPERKISVGNYEEAENTTKENESINHNDVSLKELSSKETASDSSNIRAAIKRQNRTRVDVMRSIESAIKEISAKTLHNVENDQLTRSILRMTRARKKRDRKRRAAVNPTYKRPTEMIEDMFELDSSNKKSKFTIKVTGIADDVNDIFEGLGSSSSRTTLKMNKSSMKLRNETNKGDNLSSKYTMYEERFTDAQENSCESLKSGEDLSSEFDSVDFAEDCILEEETHDDCRKSNETRPFNKKREFSAIETLFKQNKEFIVTEEEELEIKQKGVKSSAKENGRIKIEEVDSDYSDDNNQSMRFKYFRKSQDPSLELRQKINTQQEVIGKLTNQLIIYKGLEAKLANLNLQLQNKTKEIQFLKDKLENQSELPIADESDCKKDLDIKERTISILSNRVNKLKEANKKLMLQIASESQNKKLAFNLKQKDDQIKELNWKLEKASKFLDRAEKNANTYKRKMVSMQTSIRRQKAWDEKRNHFQELLIDNAKHEFSESALLTAMDIKNSCGIKCYKKLLSYNFPLPSLRTLRRRFQKENVTEDDWGDEEQEIVAVNQNQNNENDQTLTEVCQSSEFGETEITGTVQDIFEEINDAEEFNTSELGEHIFLQLKGNRKYKET